MWVRPNSDFDLVQVRAFVTPRDWLTWCVCYLMRQVLVLRAILEKALLSIALMRATVSNEEPRFATRIQSCRRTLTQL